MSANNAQSFLDLFYQADIQPKDRLADIRQAAIKHIEDHGLATMRDEDWRYTDIKSICRRQYNKVGPMPVSVDQDLPDRFRFEGLDCDRLVFIDGSFSKTLSSINALPTGVLIKNMEEALIDNAVLLEKYLSRHDASHSFAVLNTAFIRQGALIVIPDSLALVRPIHFFYFSGTSDAPVAIHPRNLVIIGKNAQASIIESYIGLDDNAPYFNNPVSEVFIGAGASLTHYKMQQEGAQADHIGHLFFDQGKDSHLLSYSIALGGRLARTDIDTRLNMPGAAVRMRGLYMVDGTQHLDNRTCIDHVSPNTCSSQDYRGILNDQGRGVFNGKVVIRKDAQQTQAHQANANLLLSKDAEIDAKPTLEIYADEVSCNHSATVGKIDEKMLFYLCSRAINKDTAKGLLIFSFAKEITNHIESTPIRRQCEQLIATQLPHIIRTEDWISR